MNQVNEEVSVVVDKDAQIEQVPSKAPVGQVFSTFPSAEEWRTINTIAQTFVQAGAMPRGIDTAPKFVVILQAGREMGLSVVESVNSLYFVNGKVAMYGEAVPLQIIRAGHKIEWGECNAKTATVTITRGDTGQSMTNTFTMEMAEARGYTKNAIYKTYPENMLKWRVLSMTAKFICPDALHGIGIKEELEAEMVQPGSPFAAKSDATVVPVAETSTVTPKRARKPLSEALTEEENVESKN